MLSLSRSCTAMRVAFNASYDTEENKWKAAEFSNLVRDKGYYQAAFHSRLAENLRTLGYGIERDGNSFRLAGIDRKSPKDCEAPGRISVTASSETATASAWRHRPIRRRNSRGARILSRRKRSGSASPARKSRASSDSAPAKPKTWKAVMSRLQAGMAKRLTEASATRFSRREQGRKAPRRMHAGRNGLCALALL